MITNKKRQASQNSEVGSLYLNFILRMNLFNSGLCVCFVCYCIGMFRELTCIIRLVFKLIQFIPNDPSNHYVFIAQHLEGCLDLNFEYFSNKNYF